ncbi:hypothetical protein GCM10009566_44700 [Streptomyces murinus]
MTAARPSAVPVAPASEVPYQSRTTGTRTQVKAAQRISSPVLSCAPGSSWRDRGPDISYSLWRTVSAGGSWWLPVAVAHPLQRPADRSVTGRASANAVQSACTGQRALRNGRGSCMLR